MIETQDKFLQKRMLNIEFDFDVFLNRLTVHPMIIDNNFFCKFVSNLLNIVSV